MDKSFCLSDKIQGITDGAIHMSLYSLDIEDVKEFIKKLKEELIMEEYGEDTGNTWIERIINKLAGPKLAGEQKNG